MKVEREMIQDFLIYSPGIKNIKSEVILVTGRGGL
jgi:hypothetical protein